jgi:hypothetical protein
VPQKIIVQDDLAIIGAFSRGLVYMVDISDPEDPDDINILSLADNWEGTSGEVTGLAIQDDVLFVSVEKDDESIICSLDISDPDETDEEDDLLDSYKIRDYETHGMVSIPGYLFISGREYDEEPSILVIDVSDTEDISLVETFDDLDGEDIGTVSMAVNGDYLFATVDVSGYTEDYEDHGYKFKIIDISDPENPNLISSSGKLAGVQFTGEGCMVIEDNYAYLLAVTGELGSWQRRDFESKIYVFDISVPDDPDLVETTKESEFAGRAIYFANDRLCLQTDEKIKIFDMSDPEDLSLDGTVNIFDILEDEIDSIEGYSPYTYPYGYSTPTPYYPYSLYSSYAPGGYGPIRNASSGSWGQPYYGYRPPPYGSYPNYDSSYGYRQPSFVSYPSFGPGPGVGFGPTRYGGYPYYGPGSSYYGPPAPYGSRWWQG